MAISRSKRPGRRSALDGEGARARPQEGHLQVIAGDDRNAGEALAQMRDLLLGGG